MQGHILVQGGGVMLSESGGQERGRGDGKGKGTKGEKPGTKIWRRRG